MLSRKFIKNQPGRRWLTYIAGLGLLVTTLTVAGIALAVHDDTFQLDGDTSTARGTTPTAGQTVDWDSLFTTTGGNTAAIDPNRVGAGFTAGAFVRDFGVKVSNADNCSLTNTTSTTFCTADATTYATGSKDTLNINPGWQCTASNNVNSKIDIMNAYAASYRAANGDKIIYFGLDKNKDNGNNNVGFWFLQGNANCVATGNGGTAFTGGHADGDVLIVSAFTNGGGVSSITAYRWAGGSNGCIDSGGDATRCDGLSFGEGADCKSAPTSDNICATTNSGPNIFNTNITTKWKTSDATLGVGNIVVPPNFFEGGINMTEIFQDAGGTAPSCFNTFIGNTRSSQSLTATLFDFARGQLGECSAVLTTQASTNATVTPGTLVYDTATITGTGANAAPFPSSDEATGGSNVKFFICELLESGACTSTTTQVGAAGGVELTSTATQGVSTATSANYDTTGKAPGRYCFYAVWAGDANYTTGASGGAEATECFTISTTTSGTTVQNWLPNDRVTVSTPIGTVAGTLSIQLIEGTLGTTCAGSTGTVRYTEPVPNGGAFTATVAGANYDTTNGTVAATTFRATATANYYWRVVFTPTSALATGFTKCETTSLTINNNP